MVTVTHESHNSHIDELCAIEYIVVGKYRVIRKSKPPLTNKLQKIVLNGVNRIRFFSN